MSTWNNERHEAARARCEAATAGPWMWSNAGGVHVRLAQMDDALVMGFARQGMDGAQPVLRTRDGIPEKAGRGNLYDYPDAAFIAHARTDLADALAEIKRLRALTTITDDKVERAGFALFRRTFGTMRTTEDVRRMWDSKQVSGGVRESYRRRARTALEAALTPGEGQ